MCSTRVFRMESQLFLRGANLFLGTGILLCSYLIYKSFNAILSNSISFPSLLIVSNLLRASCSFASSSICSSTPENSLSLAFFASSTFLALNGPEFCSLATVFVLGVFYILILKLLKPYQNDYLYVFDK